MSLVSLTAVFAGMPQLVSYAKKANAHNGYMTSNEPINWDAFIEQLHKEAKTQDSMNWNQEEYVSKVASLAGQLNYDDPFYNKVKAEYKDRYKNKPDSDRMHYQYNFEIYLVSFEKGDAYDPHDHPDMTGVLSCVSGKVRVQNYELLEHPSDKNLYLLKEVSNCRVKPGDCSTLTAQSRNIHRLEGLNRLSEMIDIFTPSYDKQRIENAKWFSILESNYENQDGIHLAKLKDKKTSN